MQEIITSLKDFLPEEKLDVIDIENSTGMAFHQVELLGGMDTFKLDSVSMAGLMLERFKKRFGVEPGWFTLFRSGNCIVIVLGPVPVSTF